MCKTNKNKVPKNQWSKWSKTARVVFNRVYEFCYNNPKLMHHPDICVPKPRYWKTTAWNAAWIAADAVDDTIPDFVIDV